MSGIIAKSNLYTTVNYRLFVDSANTLNNRGCDESGYLFTSEYALGHKRLITMDKDGAKQPISCLNRHLISDSLFINLDELKSMINEKSYQNEVVNDAEVLLRLLIEYDVGCLNKINGSFSFVYVQNDELIAARDPFGIRPLYYSFINKDIIVASEIKAILKYKKEAVVDKEGLKELLGLGPSHSPGKTLYKGIYELKPGHYLKYNKHGFIINKYYNLEAKEYNLSYEDTKDIVESILKDSVYRQAVGESNVCSFLSGGLDSSIVSMYLSDIRPNLDTFSIDYEGNKEEYKPNSFETSDDQNFIPIVVSKGNFNHKNLKVDVNTLVDTLKTSVILRDAPGMADVDGSLFWLCKNVKKTHKVAFSGECSDEIFAGYPWYYRDDGNNIGFPWIRNLEFRENLLKPELKEELKLKEYVTQKYDEIIKETPLNDKDTLEDINHRKLSYMTMNYFMRTLLERGDFMASGSSVEIRMPFSDKRLVELLYNTPFKYKYKDNVEKALLREATANILPQETLNRKKSPFPKVRSKKYEEIVTKLLRTSLEDQNSVLYKLFDINKINELLEQEEDLELPWFGQLMRKAQLIAYLYQIDYWFKEYNIRLEM